MWVDAHCHIDLFKSPTDIVRQVERFRVHTIAVTNAPFVFEHTRRLAQGCEFIHPAVGLHPELVQTHGNQLEMFRGLAALTRFVGEVGLDFVTFDKEVRHRQLVTFEGILSECASYGDRIFTVHSRRAQREVISAIGPSYPGHVILHWFSGTTSDVRRALSFGFYFSVNYAMTQSENGLRLIESIPTHRILTETDGPFQQIRGVPQRPQSVRDVIGELSKIWKVTDEEARKTVAANFETLIKTRVHP